MKTKNTFGCTYTFSAFNYVTAVLENSDDNNLIHTAKALCLYYKAASESIN